MSDDGTDQREREYVEAPVNAFINGVSVGAPEFAGGGMFAPPVLEPPVHRIPNAADAAFFLLLLLFGFLTTMGVVGLSLYFHWFGLRDFSQMQNDTRVALGSQALLYLFALGAAVPFYRMVWGKSLLDGLHWHGATAIRRKYWLFGTALLCNVLAMLGDWFMPFPQHAPIDKMFSTTTDAWLLMGFGVTVAPFFEEMIFRGFLVPAMATAWDWVRERMTGSSPRKLDDEGNPIWSVGAMVFAALTVSAPFALMHAEQVAKAWGPISLLYGVSLVLCIVRLRTRSLAASTLVHSAYNFLLFAAMFVQTDGFRHLDKM